MIPLRDTIPSRSFPFVTISLIVVNSLFFLLELMLGPHLNDFIKLFGVIPAKYFWLAEHQPGNLFERFFPLFSSMFLHGGWLHLIGNMWYLWIFGDNVEDAMGHGRFFLFYLLSGLGAGLVHIYINAGSTVPTIGASGAISGVMGAYFVLFPHSRVLTIIPIFFFIEILEIPAFFFLGFWIFLQFFQGTASLSLPDQVGGVAWWAHLGGFVFGALLSFLFVNRRRYRRATYYHRFFN